MPEDFGRRLPMDSRMVREIMRSPAMAQEQGQGFMGDWGGPTMYREMAGLPENARMTFYAIREGYTTSDQISVATGLDIKEVTKGLNLLEKRGLVTVEATQLA